jgi:hypothetical protein
MVRPFPVDQKLMPISLAYKNADIQLIGNDVLPGTPTSAEFKYLSYAVDQGYSVPDLKVGRKSIPNEVEFNATEVIDKTVDYGLDAFVPNQDIKEDNQGVDPMGTAVEFTTGLVVLGREIRVANLVFNNASYIAGQKQTLSGATQWSDQASSDPNVAIGDALDIPLMRPNIAVFGQLAWTKTRRHPKLVQAIKGTAQGAGMITRQEFIDYFELQALYVGAGFVNTAKKGQTASMSRIWGKHAAFIYRDRTAGPQNGVTFGFTAESQSRFVLPQWEDKKRGLLGSQVARVGEIVKEVICAPSCGYYFENCVA